MDRMMIAHDETASIAQAILAFRLERYAHLPRELFGETAWDFLLELFVADAVGERLTGGQIAAKIEVPPKIASRWLQHLSSIGLVVGNEDGDLDDQLTLSAEGKAKIEKTLEYARELQQKLAAARQVGSHD